MANFNVISYIQNIQTSLILTSENYAFKKVSGLSNLEGIINNNPRIKKFIAVDDSQDFTTEQLSHGYWDRRRFTVFILQKCKFGDMESREAAINEARIIYRSILSKIIKDKAAGVNGLESFDTSRVQSNEVPPAFAAGAAGLYFSFTVLTPYDLKYNDAEWNDN